MHAIRPINKKFVKSATGITILIVIVISFITIPLCSVFCYDITNGNGDYVTIPKTEDLPRLYTDSCEGLTTFNARSKDQQLRRVTDGAQARAANFTVFFSWVTMIVLDIMFVLKFASVEKNDYLSWKMADLAGVSVLLFVCFISMVALAVDIQRFRNAFDDADNTQIKSGFLSNWVAGCVFLAIRMCLLIFVLTAMIRYHQRKEKEPRQEIKQETNQEIKKTKQIKVVQETTVMKIVETKVNEIDPTAFDSDSLDSYEIIIPVGDRKIKFDNTDVDNNVPSDLRTQFESQADSNSSKQKGRKVKQGRDKKESKKENPRSSHKKKRAPAK